MWTFLEEYHPCRNVNVSKMFISNNFYNNDNAKILKDTLKNFHDFKNKQQKGMK